MYIFVLYPVYHKSLNMFPLFNIHLMVDGAEGGENLLGKELGSKARKCVATFEMVFQRKTWSSPETS